MADLKIVLGNKTYSSWSLRVWLALKQTGADFEEIEPSRRQGTVGHRESLSATAGHGGRNCSAQPYSPCAGIATGRRSSASPPGGISPISA